MICIDEFEYAHSRISKLRIAEWIGYRGNIQLKINKVIEDFTVLKRDGEYWLELESKHFLLKRNENQGFKIFKKKEKNKY